MEKNEIGLLAHSLIAAGEHGIIWGGDAAEGKITIGQARINLIRKIIELKEELDREGWAPESHWTRLKEIYEERLLRRQELANIHGHNFEEMRANYWKLYYDSKAFRARTFMWCRVGGIFLFAGGILTMWLG